MKVRNRCLPAGTNKEKQEPQRLGGKYQDTDRAASESRVGRQVPEAESKVICKCLGQ